MNLAELNGLRHLDEEILEIEEQIERLRTDAERCSQILSDMPRTSGVSDKIGRIASDIADYTSLLVDTKAERIKKSQEIHAFILEIPDEQTRRAFYLRFVQCLRWEEVARRLGGGNSADGARMRVVRYLNEMEEQQCEDR